MYIIIQPMCYLSATATCDMIVIRLARGRHVGGKVGARTNPNNKVAAICYQREVRKARMREPVIIS